MGETVAPRVPSHIDKLGYLETEDEDSSWGIENTLCTVIAVLGTLLLAILSCYCYLKCKKHASKRKICRTRSSHDRCACVQGRQHGIINTQCIQNGVYLPHYCGNTNTCARNWNPGRRFDNWYDISNEAGEQMNDHCNFEHLHHQTQHPLTFHRSIPLDNPVYTESLAGSERESVTQDVIDEPLKDLFRVTERSFTQTVCGKLLVSIARKVGNKGDVLYLDNMGISLHVPEGAVKYDETKLIVLVLNWDLSDNPEMMKDQSLVSPVVYVGPHGLKLDKPCTLIYRHCAYNPNQIRVMRSETDLTAQKSWVALSDQDDFQGKCYLTPDECQLKIEKFTLYTCVQSPLAGTVGKKWLQIAVFACPLRKEINHHQVRMYFLNKTNCALQWAIQNEAKFGGKLICPEKVFLFDGNELDMFTKTMYLSDGWELVDNQDSERISFIKIWHGQCPHISVCFRRPAQQTNSNKSLAIEMSLHVLTFQQTLEETGEKIFIQVFEDEKTPFMNNEIRCNHQVKIQINNYNTSSGERYSMESSPSSTVSGRPMASSERHITARLSESNSKCDEIRDPEHLNLVINNTLTACSKTEHHSEIVTSGSEPRLFPHSLRKRLVVLLDPPKCPYGQDWKDLASKLGLDACIPKLQMLTHPTSELLNVLESQGKSCDEVIDLFKDIGRMDCAEEMKKHLEHGLLQNNSSLREPAENTFIAYEGGDSNFRFEESTWTGSSNQDTNSWPSQLSSRGSVSEIHRKIV